MKIDSGYFEKQSIEVLRDIFANIDDHKYPERALLVINEISSKLGIEASILSIQDILGYTPQHIDHELSLSRILNGNLISGISSFIIKEGAFSDSQIKENETIWRYMRLMEITKVQNAV